MDPKLWELLRKGRRNGNNEIEAIIRLDRPHEKISGLRIISQFGPIATCRLKSKSIISTREEENVLSLKAPTRLAPEKEPDKHHLAQLDNPKGRCKTLRSRRPKGLFETGAGVVIGIVDFGCDFNHPDLKNRDGSTRLLALWDQGSTTNSSTPNSFGYGSIFTREHIDKALTETDPYLALGYRARSASHGTHVAGIAAGNGLGGGPIGVAPEADLVFVHMAGKGTSGLSNLGNSVRLLEAIDFIIKVAQNRPWVINLSVGLHGGPHDGCTPVEMALDHILREAPNRFIVQSTGNYFNKNIHANGKLLPGEIFALKVIIDENDHTSNELEVWYAAEDEFMVKTESPIGTMSPWVKLGGSAKIFEHGNIAGMLYNRRKDPNNFDNLINLFWDRRATSGMWKVHIKALKVSSGQFHAWLERDDCPNCQPRFSPDQSNNYYTTGTLANGHIPLVVGAYNAYSKNCEVPSFSSVGPTRDNRAKPDLVAPGVFELSARSDPSPVKRSSKLYTRKSGTSMAAPHVTGAVALCLQASSRPLDCYEIRELVLSNIDKVIGRVRNPLRYGHGYLNVEKVISATVAFTRPEKTEEVYAPNRSVAYNYHTKSKVMRKESDILFSMLDDLIQETREKDSRINVLAEIIPPHEESNFGLSINPDQLYSNILFNGNGRIPKSITENFAIMALPGELLNAPLEKGDVLVRIALGEPGLGHVAIISESALKSNKNLEEFGIRPESRLPGFYATVIEGGEFPHTVRDSFARRILNANGRMPSGQLLIRPRFFNIEENHEESFDKVNNAEDTVVSGASRFIAPTPKARIATLGFEFDIHFGLLEPVVKISGMSMPDDGDKITSHEDNKDGFHVKLDGPRFEIATKPFTIDTKGKKDFNSTILNILKFSKELKKRCDDFGKPQNIIIPGVAGKPRPFTHPKTIIKNLPITRLPFKKRLKRSCSMWASPQATITIPLSKVSSLIRIIRKSEGKGRGIALTGDRKGKQPRMGLRSVALYKAMVVVNKSRKELISSSPRLGLSTGVPINSSSYSESLRGFLILLVSYLFTGELSYDFSDPKPRDYETLAKAYLPINVKTPFNDIFDKILTPTERLLFLEIYAKKGAPRQRLFKLVNSKATPSSGNRKLFPPGPIESGRGVVFNRQHSKFGKVPTWHDLIDHTLNTNHNGWGRSLIVSNSNLISINKTKPLVALEMRRIGFNAVFDYQWKYLMRRIFAMTKKLNS